jgi:hypothetical protein
MAVSFVIMEWKNYIIQFWLDPKKFEETSNLLPKAMETAALSSESVDRNRMGI